MLVLALIADHEARVRLVDSLQGLAAVSSCRYVRELESQLRVAPSHAIVVTPRDEDGVSLEPLIRAVRRDQPGLPIAVYVGLTPQAAGDVVALARAGIDEVILRGHDDLTASVRKLLARTESARAAAEVLRLLSTVLPSSASSILAYCLEHAHDSLTVDALAAALGVHRKTLLNRLAAGALPPPSILISWCRLFVAARLLEDGRRTVGQVALALGFGSGTALRNMFRRYTGLRPGEIRKRGGLVCIASVFQGRCVTPPAW